MLLLHVCTRGNQHISTMCRKKIGSSVACTNAKLLRNPNFCAGCFKLYLFKNFVKVPQIGEIILLLWFFPVEFSFAEPVLVD